MCEHTPGHGTHQIMQIHPQSYNQLKGVFFYQHLPHHAAIESHV